MRSSGDNKYYFNEAEINIWGYKLLNDKNNQAAIEVLKMNAEVFPESWKAFDSLGEAYMAAGKKELAIANYEKSLQLNQDNQTGKDAIKQLKENK